MFLVAIAGVLALGVVPAVADHEDAPGKSQYGRCQALINGNSQKKWDNGKAFEIYRDVPDGSDEGDTPGELADAIEYCTQYVQENHPGNPGGNGQGNRP